LRDKLTIKQAVVVEGKYDRIRLENIIDCPDIVSINGFGIYKDSAKKALIKRYSETVGVILLTDSDNAGLQIRNYISQICPNAIHVYLPVLYGKEKRKHSPSKSGILGAEGTPDDIITAEFVRICNIKHNERNTHKIITTSELYEQGLIGKRDSSAKRKKIALEIGLPQNISTSALIKAVNTAYYDEFIKTVENIQDI